MNQRIYIRIVIDIIMAFSVIFGLWYVALPLGLVAFWIFPWYVEFLIAGFVFDALFGIGRGWGIWGFVGTIVATACASVIHVFRAVVRD